MRYRVGLVFALWAGCVIAFAGNAQSRSRLAPADEYFGRMRMSPLEITNRIRDAERRRTSYEGLVMMQAAIEDWTAKYPADQWIPPREFRMSQLFAHLRSRAGNAAATRCRAFLRAHFRDFRGFK